MTKKKRKVKYKTIFIFILFIYFLLFFLYDIVNLNIKNIYIYDNKLFSDQTIIEMAGIENYPSTFTKNSLVIAKRLEKSIYIKDVKVVKKWLTEVNIYVVENRPLFYYEYDKKTVLSDGSKVSKKFIVPTVINFVPDKKYSRLILKLNDIPVNILERISEIKYDPNDVDKNRFLLSMSDGNYVYVTLNKFSSLNNYLNMIKNFENKKGILYLDSGEYFEVID
ncbi:MAG: FtsQ-type POTRA domain-containing protein [Bacilli bacterium]